MANNNKIKVLNQNDVTVDNEEYLITAEPNTRINIEATFEDLEPETEKNIRWVYSAFSGKLDNVKLHPTLKGKSIWFKLSKARTGGGLIWIEPVLPDEQPKLIPPYGYFLNAKGPISIDKIEWREYKETNDGDLIEGDKFFTEVVQLHIYTTGLYGHDIQVNLFDEDVKFHDDLKLDEDVFDSKNKIERFYRREVKALSDIDNPKIKKQKAIINVRLEMRWTKDAGESTIEIFPAIKAIKNDTTKFKEFKDNVLTVRKRKYSDRKIISATKSGNKPTIIGNIATSTADFKPCFYTKIKGVAMRGEEKIQDVIIYQEGEYPQKIKNFPVVAGTQYSKAHITLTLDSDTDYCRITKTHTDRVIDLSEIEEAVVVESRSPVTKRRIFDSDKKFSGGEVKTRDSSDDNDENNKGANFNLNAEIDGPIGFKMNASKPDEIPVTTYSKVAISDTSVEMDLAYDFTRGGKVTFLYGLLSNMWPTELNRAKIYPVTFRTCRKEHKVNIQVFSDVKWLLSFGFNYDQDKLQEMRTSEHKKYEEVKQKIESTYEKETVSLRSRKRDLKRFKRRALKRNDIVAIEKWQHKIEQIEKKENKKRSELGTDGQIRDAKKKRNYEVRDNMEPDDALEDGLANITVSLAAEFDRPYKGLEVTPNYDKARAFVDLIVSLDASVRKLINGKNGKAQPNQENPSKLSKLKDALKGRPLFRFELIPPSLGLVFSWYAEHPKTQNSPSMGVVWEGIIKADPLFGFEFNFDILALVAKAHPIARGIVTVMDLIASLNDEAEIRLDFNVEGKAFLEGKGRVNTYSNKTNFNKEVLAKDEDDSPFLFGGEIGMAIVAEIKLINKYESWLWGNVETKIEAGAKAITGVVFEGKVKADDRGMFLHQTTTFKGIKLVFHASASVEAKADEDSDPYLEAKPVDTEKTLILMDSYEWPNNKWYLT